MKEMVLGVFEKRVDAEEAINRLHTELDIDTDEISYVYRSTDGKVREVDAGRISSSTPAEGATRGAMTGGALGAIAGLAVAAGAIPVLGPIIAAGPLVAALGLGAGALGTTAAGAITGAAAGGLIGALVNLGVDESHAQRYEDEVRSGNIVVAAHTNEPDAAASAMQECGARDVNTYSLAA